MKKFIILSVIMVLMTAPVFSQDTTKVDPNLRYVTEKIEKGISVLSEKLKAPADHVYTILVKQQKVVGWLEVGTALFFFFFTLLFIVLSVTAKYESTGETYIGFAIGCGIVFLIIVMVAIFDGLPRLINPEYYALDKILYILK